MELSNKEEARKSVQRDPDVEIEVLRRADFFDDATLPLCVFRMPYKYNVGFRAVHTHEFDEMLIVTGGTAVHQYAGKTVPMKRGDVFLIPEGRRHGYEMPDGCRMENINLLFDLSALGIDWSGLAELDGFQQVFAPILEAKEKGAVAPFSPVMHLSPGMLALLSSLVNSLESELANEVGGYQFFAKSYFSKIIGILSRVADHIPSQDHRESSELADLAAHLEEHLGEKITIADMTRFTGFSESQLRKKFQEVYSESPVRYLQRIRVERSLEMLADPKLSITYIAYEVGLGDSNYYSRIFRRINGCSPTKYREKLGRDLPSVLLRT